MEMTTEQKILMYKDKQKFVEGLSQVIPHHVPNVDYIQYKVFRHKTKGWIEEYLVLGFVGGARLARQCNGDSCGCILSEVSKYLYGGYYDEVPALVKYESDPDYDEI